MNITDLLHQTFMQHALLAALLVSVACGVIGALVVVNRLIFMAGGIAHSAYGGVGLAIFLGAPVLPTAGAFTAGAAVLLGVLTQKQRERTDTLIGVIWAAGMAFGIIMINLTPGYNVGLMSYLFGSILTVPDVDLWIMLGLDMLIVGLTLFYYRDILSFSFDPDFAQSRGIPVRWLYFMLLIMVAEAVVMMIQVVGLVLVIALLTLPPYLAERHTRSLAGLMIASAIWSFIFCLGGLVIAYLFDLSSGASIIATACAFYLGFVVLQNLQRRLRSVAA
ncbi:metal ABC transporter permease [Halothiobacillus sp.]|uniref:metal ABC transporter permease n=1 Tax=Halothiobacillus sp. TaxID=1891311 RepID=UPI002AD514D2|nr:metal ABC transporter permease [Halothiobacillus sp.]